jgi:type II secretory pathway pseudopilin PulG
MRHRGLRSSKLQITNQKLQIPQRGYIMITLMLALALVTLALLAVLPAMKQQIMRDREEEMIHRGNSYMRAIQHFYKKFGRYPTRVEELENTNNLRFLRKRYTDPMNIDPQTHKEKPFKFLQQQDITLNNGPVLPGQSGPAGQSSFGGTTGGFGATAGGLSGLQSGPGSFGAQPGGGPTGPGGAQTLASGDSSSSSALGSSSSSGSSASGGSSSGSAASGNASSGNGSDEEGNGNAPASSPSNSASGPSPSGQTFGGGPLLGVASTSKAKTIRVFFTKNHYNDWFFIYLPMADVGGLLTGPIDPSGQNGNVGGLTPGQMPGVAGGAPGQGGTGQSPFGSGFGQGASGGQSPILQPAPQPPGPAPGPQQ